MKKFGMKKTAALLLLMAMALTVVLTGCGSGKEQILIYTSVEDCLTELVFCGFLLCLCSFEASLVGTLCKDWLNE